MGALPDNNKRITPDRQPSRRFLLEMLAGLGGAALAADSALPPSPVSLSDGAILNQANGYIKDGATTYHAMIEDIRESFYREMPEMKDHIYLWDSLNSPAEELKRAATALGPDNIPKEFLAVLSNPEKIYGATYVDADKNGDYYVVSIGQKPDIDKKGGILAVEFLGTARVTIHELGHALDRKLQNDTIFEDANIGKLSDLMTAIAISHRDETYADVFVQDLLLRNGIPRVFTQMLAMQYNKDHILDYSKTNPDASEVWYDPSKYLGDLLHEHYKDPAYDNFTFKGFSKLTGWSAAREQTRQIVDATPITQTSTLRDLVIHRAYNAVYNHFDKNSDRFEAWLKARPELPYVRRQLEAERMSSLLDQQANITLLEQNRLPAAYPAAALEITSPVAALGQGLVNFKATKHPADLLYAQTLASELSQDDTSVSYPLRGMQLLYLAQHQTGVAEKIAKGWEPQAKDFDAVALRIGGHAVRGDHYDAVDYIGALETVRNINNSAVNAVIINLMKTVDRQPVEISMFDQTNMIGKILTSTLEGKSTPEAKTAALQEIEKKYDHPDMKLPDKYGKSFAAALDTALTAIDRERAAGRLNIPLGAPAPGKPQSVINMAMH